MRRVVALTVAVAGLALMVPAPTAQAHEADRYTGGWRHDGVVTYAFASGFPDGELRDRVREGARAWNSIGTQVQLVDVAEPVQSDPTSCPAVPQPNAVHWRDVDGRGGQRAYTRMCPHAGRFTFQLVLDRDERWYTGSGEPDDDELDVLSVLTHEFGHAAGFSGPFANGHYDPGDAVCASGPAQHTMCPKIPPGTTHMRSLEAHDIHTFAASNPFVTACTPYAGRDVCGAIRERYVAGYGGPPSALGAPISGDRVFADGVGRWTDFRNGSLYWHPAAGVHELGGPLRDHWFAVGGPSGALGYPTTGESATVGGTGKFVHFLNPATAARGSIFAKDGRPPYAVRGEIRDKWAALGWELGFLRFPTSDTRPVLHGLSNTFEGGHLYWSAATGAHEVHGGILAKYLQAGGPASALGFPVSDEQESSLGRVSYFERGAIYWTPLSGTVVVPTAGVQAFVV